MIIAGGCYRELCEVPEWDQLYGSGGRAAVTIANLAKSIELHTYRPSTLTAAFYDFEVMGIKVHATNSESEVVFNYLHPLARPVILPEIYKSKTELPIRVSGEAVLRFGFLEGDAVVEADRVVFDPQSSYAVPAYGANGSSAKELAIILNETELLKTAGVSDLSMAAAATIARDGAALVIVKGGVRGAQLYSADGTCHWIPAFRSNRVFKIGTGDVFSAAFAYYWCEAKLPPIQAAELASKSVATYCATRVIPLPDIRHISEFTPVGSPQSRPVELFGSCETLASRWLFEEARWALQELGVEVKSTKLPRSGYAKRLEGGESAILVLGDSLDDNGEAFSSAISRQARPAILYSERTIPPHVAKGFTAITDDFTTALYWTGWA